MQQEVSRCSTAFGDAVNRCATCRFMGAESGVSVWDPTANDGEGEMVDTMHHPCARIIHGNGSPDERGPNIKDEPAMVTDGSGYAARLRVLPTFGCVLHEEKVT